MSRWLAIFDPEGRLQPEEGAKAFSVYPWFRPGLLSVVQNRPDVWMGAASSHEALPSTYTDPGGLVVLWDGALYDREAAGPDHSDPAYLVSAFQKYGDACLNRFNGRWSFLLYNPHRQSLWLARDRVGVKPLYYWTDGVRRVFASEPKLILSLPFVERAIDPEAVFDYFVLNQVDTGKQTLFRGIRQLLPAQACRIDLQTGKWEEKAYYRLPLEPATGRFEPEAASLHQAHVRHWLEEAVQKRLGHPAGAPATLLSGGLDSSVLASLIRQADSGPVTALTASFKDPAFAEQQWAQQVAAHLGATWFQTFPTLEGLREDLHDFIFSQDTPTFSSGTYSQFCLFRLAAGHDLRAVFDGQGADALFGGHLPHLPPLWRDLFLSGQWKALRREWKTFGPWWKALAYGGVHWLKYSGIPGLSPGLQQVFKRLYYPELQFLNPDILEANRRRLKGGEWFPETIPQPNTLNQTLWNGYFGGPLSFLLKCVDRASAWNGVETCTPYSDELPLMEGVFAIPGRYKIRSGVRKRLLRESFGDLLPPSILYRQDKMALMTPNNRWMAGLRDILQTGLEAQDDAVFNRKALLKAADTFFNPDTPLENYRVYKYLSMVIWRSVFKV